MIIDTHGIIGPVTALRVYRNRVFAGCGSETQIYSTDTCEFLASFSAFSSATVHSIELGPAVDGGQYLCVFGAKCTRIFFLELEESADNANLQIAHGVRLQAASAVKEFEDWIWAAVWLQCDADKLNLVEPIPLQTPGKKRQDTIALALAHNIIIHWNWRTDTILQRVTCDEKCILYCAHFIGHQWSDLVLAAGTVFNQVVLWAPSGQDAVDSGSEPTPQPVLHRLTGHKGVIFSIFYHEGLQRLCSVSDDRSIIMYQLHFRPSAVTSSIPTDPASEDWNHVTIEPMLSVFGHSARVWDVVLLKDCFVSVGEDANCIVWDYSGEILQKHKGHKGQSIWSLAASEDETFVVTGGGDCSIRKWQLCVNQELSLTQRQLTIPHNVKTCDDDFVRSLALWNFDSVVVITNAGSTLCYNIQNDRWEILVQDADFASYATLAVSADRCFLAIGSISGHVRVLCKDPGSEGGLFETKVQVHPGKVCGLTWVNEDHFLTTGLQGHCTLARVQQSPEGALHVSIVARLELPACKHRWMVSACLVSASPSSSSVTLPSSSSSSSSSSSLLAPAKPWSHLVCGDRSGSVHCYQLSQSDLQTESLLQPKQTFPKVHGSAGVTCVRLHDDTVYTAGRDGHYRRWTLNSGSLQLLNSSRVFKGFDWLDHLWIGEQGLYILGFFSTKFVLWDAGRGEQLLEVECGGGHRSWDCVLRGQDYRFCFIKAREVVVVNGGQRSPQDIVKPPLHGKKVWEMKCLSTQTDDKGEVHHVVCTASEDTTLSLGVLQSDSTCRLQWRSQHTLHGHLSSIRALATVSSAHTPRHLGREEHHHHQEEAEHHSEPRVSSTDVSADPSRKRNSLSKVQNSTALVFSAGGRAQIQAWRVIVSGQGGAPSQPSHQKMKTVDKKLNHSNTKNSANASCAGHPATEKLQGVIGEESLEKHDGHDAPSPCSSEEASSHERENMDEPHEAKTPTCPRSGESCFSTRYEQLGGCFLGESRHKRSHKPWKTRYLKLDPETRVMCLAAVSVRQLDCALSPHLSLLAAAGSDGVLRLFLFDEHHRQFTLLCQSSHHSGCILKVFIHLHPYHPHNHQPDSSSPPSTTISDHLPVLLSAATDGRIAVWNLQPVVQWLRDHTRHLMPDSVDSAVRNETSFHHVSHTSGNTEDREVTDAANYKQSQGQEQGEGDESSEDEKEDGGDVTNMQHSISAGHSGTARTQYIGDVSSPLFCPTASWGRRGVSTESVTGEERGNQPAGGDAGRGWIPNQEIVAHQSGVNSLHVKSLTDGSLLMASGGDDNALTIHRLRLTEQGADTMRDTDSPCEGPVFHVTGKACKTDAHAAQITGVWVLSEKQVLTSSIDQRVSLWNLTEDSQIALERCRFTNLTDPSNLEIWQHEDRVYAGLCGEGLALMSVLGQEAEEAPA